MIAELAPVEMLLMQYAAGSLSPYEALIVAAHLSLKPEAKKKVSAYERVGGELMRNETPASLSRDCLDKVLGRIGSCGESPAVGGRAQREMPTDAPLPEPVRQLLSGACMEDARCWTKLSPGVMKIELRVCSSEPARRKLRLVRMAPLQQTPLHAHAGREITLVLEGGFTDVSGHYTKGDIIVINDPRFAHSPRADETGCLALSLTEAPLRFRHPLAGLLNLLMRI